MHHTNSILMQFRFYIPPRQENKLWEQNSSGWWRKLSGKFAYVNWVYKHANITCSTGNKIHMYCQPKQNIIS